MNQPETRHDQSIRITSTSIITCLGRGRAEHLAAIQTGRSGLTPATIPDLPFACYVGQVEGLQDISFPAGSTAFDNRANRLAVAALETDGFSDAVEAMKARWGAARCGVVIGTSTAGIEMLESVYRARQNGDPMPPDYSMRHHDNVQAVTAFLQEYLGLTGPSHTVSTACSSSAKSLIDAVQLIEAGVCDAVLTGGVDCLCLTSLNGFESLQLLSRSPCRPNDATRDGLSIGEAAAMLIVERDADGQGFRLSGYGESSDGVSMSTPPEDGAGSVAAIRTALARAGLPPDKIGYVNLHGTATRINDAVEARAVATALGTDVPASSLKGAIGHTLGAAGAAEAVLCLLALEEGFIPGNTGLREVDPDIAINVATQSSSGALEHVLSSSFGFGGSNCALVFSR